MTRAPDALLHLKDGDLALHQPEHLLEPLGDRDDLERGLLVGDLDGEMGRDAVGELAVILDLADGRHDLGRDLLVELHIAFEFGHDRPGERLDLDGIALVVSHHFGFGDIEIVRLHVILDATAGCALDQHLHSAVGQLQQLQDGRDGADLEDRLRRRIILARVHLRGQHDVAVRPHHLFQGAIDFFAPDEQRHDHVREHDDVAERQNGQRVPRAGGQRGGGPLS